MMGNRNNMICCCCLCWSDIAGGCMMRCWAHVDAATSRGMSGVGSGAERSRVPRIHGISVFRGNTSPPTGDHE